jgi:hypothetical protein
MIYPYGPLDSVFGLIVNVMGPLDLVFGLVALAATVFWIWMLVDCATNSRLTGNDKIIWVLIVLFLNWIGGLIYFLVIRNKTIGPV